MTVSFLPGDVVERKTASVGSQGDRHIVLWADADHFLITTRTGLTIEQVSGWRHVKMGMPSTWLDPDDVGESEYRIINEHCLAMEESGSSLAEIKGSLNQIASTVMAIIGGRTQA